MCSVFFKPKLVIEVIVKIVLFVSMHFSSPEHKVLMVSYCDRPLFVFRRRASSVVRRASCVNFFT